MTFRFSLIAVLALCPILPAHATTVGVTMSTFDNTFLTALRGAITTGGDKAKVTLDMTDAKGDVDRQIDQVKSFIAAKVDAIVVNAVDGDSAIAISKLASDANLPLVYVNTQPVNVDALPSRQAFIASDEATSGAIQTREVCKILKGKGRAVVLMGELLHYAARWRAEDVDAVLQEPDCRGISVVERQSANWSDTMAEAQVAEWLGAGVRFDAVIAANDSMALGAIRALKSAGLSTDAVVVAGIDATQGALKSMMAGEQRVTVFQNAAGQGEGALDAALRMARGETVPQKTFVPFELVTLADVPRYLNRN